MFVYLDDRCAQYLLSWAHLRNAENQREDDSPTTSAGDFFPADVDQAIYEALAKAALDEERNY
jgi:hypothetical protein